MAPDGMSDSSQGRAKSQTKEGEALLVTSAISHQMFLFRGSGTWAETVPFRLSLMKVRIYSHPSFLLVFTLLTFLCWAGKLTAAESPDRFAARRAVVEAGLIPTETVPKSWLMQRIHAGQVVEELERQWKDSLQQEPPVENVAGKKNAAQRGRERDESVERRDVFLACLDKDKKGHVLYRFDGGAGKPFGYVIMKNGRAVYWYPIGTRSAN